MSCSQELRTVTSFDTGLQNLKISFKISFQNFEKFSFQHFERWFLRSVVVVKGSQMFLFLVLFYPHSQNQVANIFASSSTICKRSGQLAGVILWAESVLQNDIEMDKSFLFINIDLGCFHFFLMWVKSKVFIHSVMHFVTFKHHPSIFFFFWFVFISCFLALSENNLIFLDPHTTQPAVDIDQWGHIADESYHCASVSTMLISSLDPSIALVSELFNHFLLWLHILLKGKHLLMKMQRRYMSMLAGAKTNVDTFPAEKPRDRWSDFCKNVCPSACLPYRLCQQKI